MLISKREREPAHYTLKIESFSLLQDAELSKIESDAFEAGGHRWILELYPNGDDANKGTHISIYLVICDIQNYSEGWEVCVHVHFFVYDHIRHNYATSQDVNGEMTRFHKKETAWGYEKLISLESFTLSENGYLFNDSCVFGVEIITVPAFTQVDRCLSMTKPPTTMNSHTWTINNFSTVTEDELNSEVFKVGKVKWKLSLYPEGFDAGDDTYLSIYLGLHDAASLLKGLKIYVKFKIRVKSQVPENDIEKEAYSWFSKNSTDWGFSSFMKLSTLNDSENGFLLDDNLTVEVEISAMGMLKRFI